MVKLNENMGSTDRCQGGFLSMDEPELDPDTGEEPATEPGLTELRILDYKEARFLNFEASINFPEALRPPPPFNPSLRLLRVAARVR